MRATNPLLKKFLLPVGSSRIMHVIGTSPGSRWVNPYHAYRPPATSMYLGTIVTMMWYMAMMMWTFRYPMQAATL
jgi:hypothetical protein